jgi:hypothetical protein
VPSWRKRKRHRSIVFWYTVRPLNSFYVVPHRQSRGSLATPLSASVRRHVLRNGLSLRVALDVAYGVLLLLELVMCTEYRGVEDQRVVAGGRLLDGNQQVASALTAACEPHLHADRFGLGVDMTKRMEDREIASPWITRWME